MKKLILSMIAIAAIAMTGKATCTANAGTDGYNCAGSWTGTLGGSPSGTISCASNNYLCYSWAPSTGLSCTTCPNPSATVTTTRTYTLTVSHNNATPPTVNCVNDGCCDAVVDFVTITVDCSCCRLINPAMEPEVSGKNIQVFPNPSNGQVKVTFGEVKANTTINVFDATGQNVYSGKPLTENQKDVEIDLSEEAKGVYFIKIMSGEELLEFKKIIIQ